MLMRETTRVGGPGDAVELSFGARIATPTPLKEAGLRLHISGVSRRKTISLHEKVGVVCAVRRSGTGS